jgi:predicted AlkP superfamily phosphohydrolase/phosphomutase
MIYRKNLIDSIKSNNREVFYELFDKILFDNSEIYKKHHIDMCLSFLSLENNIIESNRQSFLIRRWIPKAGYIYLDVDASLGKGIVKPEFITDGIQAKIPQIVKELTDKVNNLEEQLKTK